MVSIEYCTKDPVLKEKVDRFVKDWYSSSATVQIMTSGSTGQPKIINIQKEFMIKSAQMTGEFLKLQPGINALLCLPVTTIAGAMMVVRSIVLDLHLIVADVVSDPLTNIEVNINFAAMVPMQAQRTLEISPIKFSNISKIIIGGGGISPSLDRLISDCDNECYHTFGMTETISHIAMRRISDVSSSYKTLPGVQVSSNENALVINAPNIGVHNLETNDIVEIINEHSFNWIGRSDFAINSGGIKIHPEQIENNQSSFFQFWYSR